MKHLFFILISTLFIFSCCHHENDVQSTEIIIKNDSEKDSIKVYLTLQSTESAEGHFGITKEHLTPHNPSQGYFWALKDSSYHSNNNGNPFTGFAISFDTTNLPCANTVGTEFVSGINVFEGSLNVEYESFDISCMDGLNSILNVEVSDTVNWKTGIGAYTESFKSTQNDSILQNNCNIRGVYPYRCTDCIDNPKPTKNCFNLPLKCSSERSCQVNRAKHIGGTIILKYLGSVRDSSVAN